MTGLWISADAHVAFQREECRLFSVTHAFSFECAQANSMIKFFILTTYHHPFCDQKVSHFLTKKTRGAVSCESTITHPQLSSARSLWLPHLAQATGSIMRIVVRRIIVNRCHAFECHGSQSVHNVHHHFCNVCTKSWVPMLTVYHCHSVSCFG